MDNLVWMPYKDWMYKKTFMEMMEEKAIFKMTGWLGIDHPLPLSEEMIQERIKIKENVHSKTIRIDNAGNSGNRY